MLKQGNSVELLKELESNSIDLIITDPPYKTTKRGNSGGTGGMLKEDNFIKGNGGFANNDVKIRNGSNRNEVVVLLLTYGYWRSG